MLGTMSAKPAKWNTKSGLISEMVLYNDSKSLISIRLIDHFVTKYSKYKVLIWTY